MQCIGRLRRDGGPGAVRGRLGEVEGSAAQAGAAHRRRETLRERLLDDAAALTGFAAEHPGADLQALRSLIRNSRKQLQEGNRTRAYRELFRFIRLCSEAK